MTLNFKHSHGHHWFYMTDVNHSVVSDTWPLWGEELHAPLSCNVSFSSAMVIPVSFLIVSSQWVLRRSLLLFLLITPRMIDFFNESALMTGPKSDSLCLANLTSRDIFGKAQSRTSSSFLQSMRCIIVISSITVQRSPLFPYLTF